ncbi:MAG: hypothetical protein GXY83_22745 [Rhodopirellula sp.]|nr:hypothetical protein [Rhodopirellula sp.]
MKIVISHVTRMQKGFICVAGVDLATRQHVRPVLRSQMRKALLARYGGPFDIGRIVDLGWTRYVGSRPETEDYLFHAGDARVLGDMPAREFWALLQGFAKRKLGEIFGKDLLPCGLHCCAVDEGRGIASLGCFVPSDRPRLCFQRHDPSSRGRIRIGFTSGAYDFELAVTDIRLYGEDHVTPNPEAMQRAAYRLQTAPGVILGVGLTRPFKGEADEPARHWLQVNNLHFEDDPCWRLD